MSFLKSGGVSRETGCVSEMHGWWWLGSKDIKHGGSIMVGAYGVHLFA